MNMLLESIGKVLNSYLLMSMALDRYAGVGWKLKTGFRTKKFAVKVVVFWLLWTGLLLIPVLLSAKVFSFPTETYMFFGQEMTGPELMESFKNVTSETGGFEEGIVIGTFAHETNWVTTSTTTTTSSSTSLSSSSSQSKEYM